MQVFDEAIVNAADNKQRDSNTSKIDIKIETDKKTGNLVISVENDGFGVPVAKNPLEDNLYVPTLVFGHLLTGSNFDNSKVILFELKTVNKIRVYFVYVYVCG